MQSTLFYNIASLVCIASRGELRKSGSEMQSVAELQDAFLVVTDGKIEALGPMRDTPSPAHFKAAVDCSGRILLPGFVDSHTHVLYAGDRADEFEMRAAGKSYQEIAAAGGGIKRSVTQVREASLEQLVEETLPRIREMLAHGTTTVEIKSGYGLSLESELKMLRAIRQLRSQTPMEIHPTLLGAHDIPAGVPREKYLQLVMDEMIPQVAAEKLAEFCDVFCDTGYFTPEETRRIAQKAQTHGLQVRIHANELAASGGVEVAVEVGALSADHLLCVKTEQLQALTKGKVVCTLLPGTAFFLKLPYAPARQMIDAGLTVALATDANPGSCTALSLPFILNLATTQMGMSPAEALTAATLNGAASLGISRRVGSLEVGKEADLIITVSMKNFREIPYRLGQNPCWRVYKHGNLVSENSPRLT